VFCGGGPMSDEDVVPRWLTRSLVPIQPATLRVGTTFLDRTDLASDRAKPINSISVGKVRAVCQRCNNGWMSRLEKEAGPLLRSLFRGQEAVIEGAQQVQLANWTMKTAMMLALRYRRDASAGLMRRLHEAGLPGPSDAIWLARIEPETVRFGILGLLSQPDADTGVKIHGFMARFVFANVGLIVYCNPTRFQPHLQGEAIEQALAPLWPKAIEPLSWPIDRSITANEMERLARVVVDVLSLGHPLAPAPAAHAYPGIDDEQHSLEVLDG
jgi:hypothetical protein